MRPCEICGDRKMLYGGICDSCKTHRSDMMETQWRPSYEAATARLDLTPSLEQGFGADFTGDVSKIDKAAKRRNRKTRGGTLG